MKTRVTRCPLQYHKTSMAVTKTLLTEFFKLNPTNRRICSFRCSRRSQLGYPQLSFASSAPSVWSTRWSRFWLPWTISQTISIHGSSICTWYSTDLSSHQQQPLQSCLSCSLIHTSTQWDYSFNTVSGSSQLDYRTVPTSSPAHSCCSRSTIKKEEHGPVKSNATSTGLHSYRSLSWSHSSLPLSSRCHVTTCTVSSFLRSQKFLCLKPITKLDLKHHLQVSQRRK